MCLLTSHDLLSVRLPVEVARQAAIVFVLPGGRTWQLLVWQVPVVCTTMRRQYDGTSSLIQLASFPYHLILSRHKLEPNLPLIIGGVNIPHDRGCEAHSDGDVLLHCVVDAILGALGLPDIGQIFPDNDPKWKGAASSVFVKEAVRLMHEAGYTMGNLDATLILQRPKLSPHKEAIRSNLCELLGADPSVVNIKAKTHEKVDSLGENRSIAAHTVVLLMKK
ncbi:hypothetical protein GOP47_0029176 [Adiantum capillus-veneris]|nr:hypothetical protein GOP47_0029176 [Adiantum capillus-veneris]